MVIKVLKVCKNDNGEYWIVECVYLEFGCKFGAKFYGTCIFVNKACKIYLWNMW